MSTCRVYFLWKGTSVMEQGCMVKITDINSIFYGETGLIISVAKKPLINKVEQLFKVRLPEGNFWYMKKFLVEV